MSDPLNSPPPLPVLFSKPQKDQLRVSPLGTHLAWRARGADTGVLNIWVQKRNETYVDQNTSNNDELNKDVQYRARQITFARDRDVCIRFYFSTDDRTILYLNEPSNGSEAYHVYAIDLHDSNQNAPSEPRDLCAQHPRTTCAIGFIGGVQLWLNPATPRNVLVSTSTGKSIWGLFWDVSSINLDTSEITIVERNPLSTWMGVLVFVGRMLLYLVKKHVLRRAESEPPRVPIQWFPDDRFRFRGRLEIGVLDLSCAWRVCAGGSHDSGEHQQWITLHQLQREHVSMQLIGSSGGAGTAHMDIRDEEKDGVNRTVVDLHTCHFQGSDTTSYERFHVSQSKCSRITTNDAKNAIPKQHIRQIASCANSDITGFVLHPKTRQVQCVLFHADKPSIHCLPVTEQQTDASPAHDLTPDIEFLQSYAASKPNNSNQDVSITITSRSLNDDLWVVYFQSDAGLAICGNCPSGYFLYHRQGHSDLQHPAVPTTKGAPAGPQPPSSLDPKKIRRLEKVFSPQPRLANYSLGSMIPIHVPSRDGEDLLCYLSVPPPSHEPNTGSSVRSPVPIPSTPHPTVTPGTGYLDVFTRLSIPLHPRDHGAAGQLPR